MFVTLLLLMPGIFCLTVFAVGMKVEQRSLFNGMALTAGLAWLALCALILWLSRDPGAEPSNTRTIVEVLVIVGSLPLALLVSGIGLVLNGRKVIQREGLSLSHLLAPGVGALCLGLLGYVALIAAFQNLTALVVLTNVAPLLVYGGFLLVSWVIFSEVYARWPRRTPKPYIVVHGAGLINGNVTPLLARRLDRAMAVASQWGTSPKIICSGGQGPDEPVSEASAMREYLLAKGIPDGRILLEDRSTTTEENLAYSRDLMPPKTDALMVTSGYHALRAGILARRLRMDAQATGAPVAAYYVPSATIREFIAWVVMTKWWHISVVLVWLAVVVGSLVS